MAKIIKHIHKSFKDPQDMVEWLDSMSDLNQTIEGVWGTPKGVHLLMVLWDTESINQWRERDD